MQPGYFQGNPPPYQRPGSSAPPYNYQQGPPPPPPSWPGGPQAGAPQNMGTPYQHPPAHNQGPPQYQQQPWSGPPPSAPPANHVSTSNYNPNSYGPMPNSVQSPISPIRHSQDMNVQGPGPFQPAPGYHQPLQHGADQVYAPGGGPPGSLQSNPAALQQPYGNQGPPFQAPAHIQQPFHPPQQDKPPLPPRPGSVVQRHQSQSHPLSGQSSVPLQQIGGSQGPQQIRQSYLAGALGQGRGDHYNQANPYAHNIGQSQIPPPPPPLPQGYQTEVLQNQQGQPQHPPYSHQPPTHRYEPQTQHLSASTPFNSQVQDFNQVQSAYSSVPHVPTSQTPSALGSQPPAQLPQSTKDNNQHSTQQAPINGSVGGNGGTFGQNASQQYFISSPPAGTGIAWAQQHEQAQSAPSQPLQQYGNHSYGDNGSSQPTSHPGRPPSTFQKAPLQPSSDHNQQSIQPLSNQSDHPGWNGQNGNDGQPQQHVRAEQIYQSSTALMSRPHHASLTGHEQDRQNHHFAHQVQSVPSLDESYPQNMSPGAAPSTEHHPTFASIGHSDQPPRSSVHASHDAVASNQAKVLVESPRHVSLSLQNPASTAAMNAAGPSPSSRNEAQQEKDIGQKQKPFGGNSDVSALGSGGPSDWEHFGVSEVDEIDDTAIFSGKKPDTLAMPTNEFAELSSQPSPTVAVKQHSQSSQISNPSDVWPTPPPLAPLALHKQAADFSPNRDSQHDRLQFVPTPPLDTLHSSSPLQQNPSSVSAEHDRHDTIDEALQTWALSGGPLASSKQNQSSGAPITTDQSLADAGNWPQEQKMREKNVIQDTRQQGGVSDHGTNQPKHDASHAQSTPTQNFVVDDGGWLREAAKQRIVASSPPSVSEAASSQLQTPPSQTQQFVNRSSHTGTQTDTPGPKEWPQDPSREQLNTAQPVRPIDAIQPSEGPQDPYAHLDPWYKESLGRYATMLKSESQAATDQERTKIFTEFMMAESRLRGVRYGSAIGTGSTTTSEPNDPVPKQPTQNQGQATRGAFATSKSGSERMPSPISSAESYVVVNSPDDGDFSPGGRPIIARVPPDVAMHAVAKPDVNPDSDSGSGNRLAFASPVPEQERVSTPQSRSIEQIEHSTVLSQAPFPGFERPLSPPSNHSIDPAPNPLTEKPVYKPFRYNAKPSPHSIAPEVKSNGSPQPIDAESFKLDYKAYSPNKNSLADRAAAGQSAPATVPATQYRATANGNGVRAETMEGEHAEIPANKLLELQSGRSSTPLGPQGRQVLAEPQRPAKHHTENKLSGSEHESDHLADIRSILPAKRGQAEMSTRRLDPVKQAIGTIAGDFHFIEDLTKSWNLEAKKLRDKNNQERRIRQEEQDEHTSRLFDEEAIGYGDLGALDDEFKQSETEKNAQEDRAECQDYVTNVFDPVYNRLQEQIQQLMEQYVYCIDLMKEAVTGKEALEAHGDRPNLIQVMDIFLDLHRKIELRHRKVSQAILNRDRQFGKTEVQLLYHVGKIAKMKQMERHFAEAEKKATLDAANKCDERAKSLLDIVEENTIRAVEINQDYMDVIMQIIRKSEGATLSSTTPTQGADSLQRELVFAQDVLRSLAAASEKFMEHFYDASQILNTAEHEALLAESTLANADLATLTRLNEEQKAEETRLKQELDHRLAIVRDDSKKANEYIESLLSQPSRSDDSNVKLADTEEPAAVDPEHQERIKKALEAAKKRNMAKSPDVYAPPE
ncbi:MAG: hypothetical protein M1812_004855 [Candelaria pacifica]|nr:MAG: hypothetical protein M1812_004855 [Candelaria pacifica]